MFYRPQRSYGKVMFLHLSVNVFTGGVFSPVHAGIHTPQSRHPPGQTPPWADTPWVDTPRQIPLGRHTLPSPWQTPSWADTLLGRHPPGQTPSWADTLLDRHPPGQTPSWADTLLGRHPPPGQTPLPWADTSPGRYFRRQTPP